MISEQEVENYLEHYGVKGMKWGQRKTDDSSPLKFTYNPDKRQYDLNRNPTTGEIYKARKKMNDTRDALDELNSRPGARYTRAESKERQRETNSPVAPKYRLTQEHGPLLRQLTESDDAAIALYKTDGERIAATLLGGAIGAYVTRNTKGGLKNRASEGNPDRRYKIRKDTNA